LELLGALLTHASLNILRVEQTLTFVYTISTFNLCNNLLSILPDKVLANSMANNLPIFLAYIMKFS
jgi:hypothetical protein